jgi:hypothetical protein
MDFQVAGEWAQTPERMREVVNPGVAMDLGKAR